jgi:serine/threonine-protein kinase CHEK2
MPPEILELPGHRKYNNLVDVWSLGVILYICLCGFPPLSDELYTAETPYSLFEQIKMGRFDCPLLYWDQGRRRNFGISQQNANS